MKLKSTLNQKIGILTIFKNVSVEKSQIKSTQLTKATEHVICIWKNVFGIDYKLKIMTDINTRMSIAFNTQKRKVFSFHIVDGLLLLCIGELELKHIKSNLCTTTTLGTQKYWPLLTSCRCSEVIFVNKNPNYDLKMVVVIDSWSLFGGGHYHRFDY